MDNLHKQYGLLSNIRYLLKEQFKLDKILIILTFIAFVFAPFNHYMWSFVTKFIIDAVTNSVRTKELIILISGCVLAHIFVNIMFIIFEMEKGWRFTSARLYMMIKRNRKIMTMDYEKLESSEVMDCYQKAGSACSGNYEGVEGMMHKFTDFVSILSVVAVGIIIMGRLHIVVMIIMFVVSFLNFLIKNKVNKLCKEKVWDPIAMVWRKNQYMENTTFDFEFAKDIRMYGAKEYLINKLRNVNSEILNAHKSNRRYWLIANEIGNVLWFLCQGTLYGWLVYSVIEKYITLGDFSLYLSSSFTFFTYVTYLFNSVGEMMKLSLQVDDFRSFMDIKNDDEKGQEEIIDIPKFESYEFTFEDVSFKYPNAKQYALKNLNLTLAAGERLAVVGLNGAGKTTFIKLLLRLYEPTSGRILLNGIDIKKFDKTKYYDIFAPVFQDVNIYAFPMAENVSMKEPENTDKDKARTVLEMAGLDTKIKSLEKGVDTQLLKIIYDDGIDLSGGEKQKLALARALYKKAPVVILDEPTAALDALAEAKLYEDFDKLIGNKTSVYISHRLSSTRFCSHIAMFEDGKMVEYGTHDTLIDQNGAYANMFNLQAQYYIDQTDNAGEEGKLNA